MLVKKSELAFATLSSYSLDFPWIYDFFDPSIPVIMVAQPDANGRAAIKYTFPTWIKTTPPLRGGYGCQHMKVCHNCFLEGSALSPPISLCSCVLRNRRQL